MYLLVFFCLIGGLSAVPINVVQKAIDNDVEKQDNYLPKVGDFPKFHYASVGENTHVEDELLNAIDFPASYKENLHNIVKVNQQEKPKSFGDIVDFVKDGAAAGMDILKDIGQMFKPTSKSETGTEKQEAATAAYETTTETEATTVTLEKQFQLDPVILDDNDNITTNRTIRQEEQKVDDDDDDSDNDIEVNKEPDTEKEKESQESEEEEEEEEPDMITGLLSAFLGGLSRPDGSVDVEAITGLLGSLSSQKDDGTYDFNGLTELLMSFFGGGGEDGGGSNFGAFVGGLLGAFIKGVANPPGAKGAGTFLGNLVGAVLPGLSAPAPDEEGENSQKPQPAIDSGGFFSGLLSSVSGTLGSLSNSGSSGGGDNTGGGGNKFSLFKAIFSSITGIFSSSSTPH